YLIAGRSADERFHKNRIDFHPRIGGTLAALHRGIFAPPERRANDAHRANGIFSFGHHDILKLLGLLPAHLTATATTRAGPNRRASGCADEAPMMRSRCQKE